MAWTVELAVGMVHAPRPHKSRSATRLDTLDMKPEWVSCSDGRRGDLRASHSVDPFPGWKLDHLGERGRTPESGRRLSACRRHLLSTKVAGLVASAEVRSYGNENWEYDEHGLNRVRHACINDLPIRAEDRKFHWSLGRRPDDHPGLTDLGL